MIINCEKSRSVKTILKIAKSELNSLFFSPVAWVVLIIFWIQSGWIFFHSLELLEKNQQLGTPLSSLTGSLFTADYSGLFTKIQANLYLYVPLLTMGLISREISSGSIKLILSSPVRISQLILGKFAAIATYCFLLIAILGVYIGIAYFSVEALDVKCLLSGMLGLFLLICTYASIGLFMSCLTSYQVIVAICTLVVLGFLNMVGTLWQDIDIIRDVTYFLSISGRANKMIRGLIISRDIIYFILVTGLFIGLSMLKLHATRESRPFYIKFVRYVALFLAIVILGVLTSMPATTFYYDMTVNKSQTITPNSQKVVRQFKKPLQITTYVNLLDEIYYFGIPQYKNQDLAAFDQYRRFLPNLKMDYVYYYDKSQNKRLYAQNPHLTEEELLEKVLTSRKLKLKKILTPEQIKEKINLEPEENRFVRQLEYNGHTTFLRMFDDLYRYPFESETTAALKRLIQTPPKIAFLTGNNERNISKIGDKDYKTATTERTFRYSLINQGFDLVTVNIDSLNQASDISVLVIADPQKDFSDEELTNLKDYLARGKNLFILGDVGNQNIVNPLLQTLGYRFSARHLVQKSSQFSPDFIIGQLSGQTNLVDSVLSRMSRPVTMPGVLAVEKNKPESGYTRIPVVVADAAFSGDTATSNQTMSLALTKQVNGRQQRIMLAGDADFMDNSELSRNNIQTGNFQFMIGIFRWFSYGEFPVVTSRPETNDRKITIDADQITVLKTVILIICAIIIGLAGGSVLIIRNRR